jgi:mono/diheme cytochrome c family protein
MNPIKKSKITLSAAVITGCSILFSFSSVNALDKKAQLVLGKMEYMSNCASCHGKDAKGGGPVAAVLSIKPSDLTMISKAFSGKFPEDHVYKVIDGRDMINPHGDTDMPVWGDRYMSMAQKAADRVAFPFYEQDAQALAFGRITSLVDYLESIQVK